MPRILWGDNEQRLLSEASAFTGKYFPRATIVTTTDPENLIAATFQETYDLVVTDFNYEGELTGLDVIRQIRRLNPSTPIYLCTNRIASQEARDGLDLKQLLESQAKEAGASGVISKMDLKHNPDYVADILRKHLQ